MHNSLDAGVLNSLSQPSLGIITFDEEGRVLAWNEVSQAIFGWTAEEVIGRAPPHLTPDQREFFNRRLAQALQGRPQFSPHLRGLRKDGSPVAIKSWLSLIPQSAQSPRCVLELVEDLTGLEHNQPILSAPGGHQEAILNALPAHIAVIDAQGQITSTNRGWDHFALQNGIHDPGSVGVGVNYLEVCRSVRGGEDYPYAHAALVGIQAVLAGKRGSFELEYPCHSPREKRWFLMRVTPLGAALGGAVITHETITRRYFAELARQTAEKRLSAILNIAVDCIIALDGSRRVLLFNRWAEHVFGYTAAEIIGQSIERLIPAHLAGGLFARLDQPDPDNQPTERVLLHALRKGGAEFPAEASVAAVSLENQPLVVLVISDITDRARAEEQINTYAARQKMLAEISLQINKLQTAQEISMLATVRAREIIGAHLAITTQESSGGQLPSIQAVSRSEKYTAYSDLEMIAEERGMYTLANQDNQLLLLTQDQLIQAPILNRGGTKLGTIQLADKYEGAFDDSDAAVLVQVAQVAAVAMENALLYEEVRQAERKYRSIFENSIEGLFQITSGGDLLSGNPALAHLLGYANIDELLYGQPEIRLFIFANPEDYDHLLEGLNQTGAVAGFETRLRRRDGSQFWASLSINARSVNQDGQPILEGSLMDISERRRRLRELEALAETSSTLREAGSRAEMIPIILDQLQRSIGADSALFFYDDEETGLAQVDLARGGWSTLSGLRLENGDPRLAALRSARSPLALRPQSSPLFALDMFAACSSLAAAPLHIQGQFSGALWLGLRAPADGRPAREFTEEDTGLLAAIVDVASNAIMRSSLNEQIAQRLRTILALHSIDIAISSSLDARLTTRIILEQGASLLGVDAMDVLRYNRVTQNLEYTAGRGFQTGLIEQSRQRLGEGLSGTAALERKTVVIPQLAAEPNFKRVKMAQAEKFVFYAAVPLIAKGQLKGLLEVFSRLPLQASNEWRELLETLATETAIALDNNQLFEDLQHSNIELTLAYDATIEGWGRALELKDRETEGHSQRVTQMTVRLARRLGAAEEDLVHIQRGSQLHDIGKMGIPDSILLKPGPLSADEWVQMRSHVELGLSMLSAIPFLKRALDIPRWHHEKWDGTGYPDRLQGRQIPLAARVFAVIDVWDALSYDRPYREAWPQEKVLAYLREESGKHFDPEVLAVFLQMMDEDEFQA